MLIDITVMINMTDIRVENLNKKEWTFIVMAKSLFMSLIDLLKIFLSYLMGMQTVLYIFFLYYFFIRGSGDIYNSSPNLESDWITPVSCEKKEEWFNLIPNQEAVEKIKEILDCSSPSINKYMKMHNEVPIVRNMIFYGPPGTGKSFAASIIAKDLSSSYKIVAAGGLQQKFVGSGAKNWSDIIDKAKKLVEKNHTNKPVFIIVEEIDSLCKRMDNDFSSVDDTLLNNFLESIDSIGKINDNGGIVVVGTTNYIENIAPSAKRSGRFSQIYFGEINSIESWRILVDFVKREIEKIYEIFNDENAAKLSQVDNFILIEDCFWKRLKNLRIKKFCTFVVLKEHIIKEINKKIERKLENKRKNLAFDDVVNIGISEANYIIEHIFYKEGENIQETFNNNNFLKSF
jgi:Cdc6-like AAA superfamily ATPase